ncbi:MAG: DNA polymerase [Patescibacteria group bacterium]
MDYKKPPFEYISKQSRLTEVVNAELAKQSILAVDVESDGLDPHTLKLLLVQIGIPGQAFVINAKLDLAPLKTLLENPEILKLVQNGKFDYSALKVTRSIEMRNMYDTMLSERLLTVGMERENSLLSLAAKYTGVQLDKDWESLNWYAAAKSGKFSEAQLRYAAVDVVILFPIYAKQKEGLAKEKLETVAKLEFNLMPVVAEIEIKGSKIDVNKWRENLAVLSQRRDEIARQIQEELRPYFVVKQMGLFGQNTDVLNLNSPMQVMEAFRKLGIDIPSTGEAILAKVDHPVAKLLLKYRENEKLLTAFGENLLEKIHPKTGRIHPDFQQIGADTGRFACSNPNLQQIPTDSAFRSCFIPEPGYKFIVGDYSQIELRIMAELSQDPVFLNAFRNNDDLHTLTASQMYNIPREQVDKKMRFNAKSINFGLMYGRGANSLSIQLGVSFEEAEKLLAKYFATYKKVKSWLDKVGREAVRKGYSTTLSGRKRWYRESDPGDPGYLRAVSHIERQGKNTPIQGTSADMTKFALVGIYNALKDGKYDAFPIHTVHDEIVVEVREDQAEEVKEIVEREMVKSGQMLLKSVPVLAEVKVSNVWEH